MNEEIIFLRIVYYFLVFQIQFFSGLGNVNLIFWRNYGISFYVVSGWSRIEICVISGFQVVSFFSFFFNVFFFVLWYYRYFVINLRLNENVSVLFYGFFYVDYCWNGDELI